jgi:hypothetical protein
MCVWTAFIICCTGYIKVAVFSDRLLAEQFGLVLSRDRYFFLCQYMQTNSGAHLVSYCAWRSWNMKWTTQFYLVPSSRMSEAFNCVISAPSWHGNQTQQDRLNYKTVCISERPSGDHGFLHTFRIPHCPNLLGSNIMSSRLAAGCVVTRWTAVTPWHFWCVFTSLCSIS